MLAVGKTGNAKSGNALAKYELGQKYHSPATAQFTGEFYSPPNGFAIQSITISIASGKSAGRSKIKCGETVATIMLPAEKIPTSWQMRSPATCRPKIKCGKTITSDSAARW